jgi:hypothetical protein
MTSGRIILTTLLSLGSACHSDTTLEQATRGLRLTSPSGQFVLLVTQPDSAQNDMLGFRIQDATGNVVFTPHEHWSDRHRLHFTWDASDRAWCYSSDVGTDLWERQADGAWQHKAWVDTNLVPPQSCSHYYDADRTRQCVY